MCLAQAAAVPQQELPSANGATPAPPHLPSDECQEISKSSSKRRHERRLRSALREPRDATDDLVADWVAAAQELQSQAPDLQLGDLLRESNKLKRFKDMKSETLTARQRAFAAGAVALIRAPTHATRSDSESKPCRYFLGLLQFMRSRRPGAEAKSDAALAQDPGWGAVMRDSSVQEAAAAALAHVHLTDGFPTQGKFPRRPCRNFLKDRAGMVRGTGPICGALQPLLAATRAADTTGRTRSA